MEVLILLSMAIGAALMIPSPRAQFIRQHRCEGCNDLYRCRQCEDIILYAQKQKDYKGSTIYSMEHAPKGGGGAVSQERWLCEKCKACAAAPTVVEKLLRVL